MEIREVLVTTDLFVEALGLVNKVSGRTLEIAVVTSRMGIVCEGKGRNYEEKRQDSYYRTSIHYTPRFEKCRLCALASGGITGGVLKPALNHTIFRSH